MTERHKQKGKKMERRKKNEMIKIDRKKGSNMEKWKD